MASKTLFGLDMMNPNGDPSVAEIMQNIRRAVNRSAVDECFPKSPQGEADPGSWLVPGFFIAPSLDLSRQHYRVEEFLRYRDRTFVVIAYKALLKREPDSQGLEHYLRVLRGNPAKKTVILATLSDSGEGRALNVQVEGLERETFKLRMQRTPLLGRLVRLFFRVNDAVRFKRAFAMQEDRLGRLVEEAGQALKGVALHAEKRLEGKMDKKDLEKKANVWDLEAKADKRELEKKVDVQDMQRYLRSVGHVLDMVSEMQGGQQGPKSAPDGLDAYSGQWLDDLYFSFEEDFRGSRLSLQRRMALYLPTLQEVIDRVSVIEKPPMLPADCAVLDLGCGRGEFLELLSKSGVEAMGVDENRFMVDKGRKTGVNVRRADIFAFLSELPSECLAAVTAFHVIEHLPFDRQLYLIDQIRRVLAPGGLVILETPNPCNILAGAVDFYRDPTHLRPVHPDTLLFLARARGFDRAGIFYPNEYENAGPVLEDASHMHFTDLQDYVRVSRDYALMAYKPHENE